jgi:uncharacterized protein (DUF2147 family)
MHMLAVHIAALVLALLAPAASAAAQEQQGIRGTWWTKGKEGRVEIVDCEPADKGLCGRIVWISKPLTDRLNPNKGLRSREIVGLQLIEGWRENGANK